MLWQILVQFILRLGFGMSVSKALTSPQHVTSGFYRVHLWVLLGLNTFASVAVYSQKSIFTRRPILLPLVIAAAILSYVGAVVWLYEKDRPGTVMLWIVAGVSLIGAIVATPGSGQRSAAWLWTDIVTSGMLLGTTITAMFLGHWYLNTPSMNLLPLRRLLVMMAIATVVRAVFCGIGLAGTLGQMEAVSTSFGALVALRWLAGLVGVLGLTAMTWQTLKIPNTQSATGILYVAVIFAFLGELTSQLLSAEAPFPL